MGLEGGRLRGGIILRLKACGRVKRTGGISDERTTYCACITNAMQCVRSLVRATGRACVRTCARTYMRTCVHIHMRTHIPSARQTDLAVGRVTDRLAYLPTCLQKKPKSLTKSLKRYTPRRVFKSFRFARRSRNMGILSKPSARAAKIHNFVV